MDDKLKIQIPPQGWRQIQSARTEMLASYDTARAKSKAHEVETDHGRAAEAAFRKWLSEFLPKRYGVTSGYVVSPGLSDATKTPHFDVIIYDQLESPVLWREENPDRSNQGSPRAIPVEYVYAVLEVKSSFTVPDVKKSIEHLNDLSPVMKGSDEPDERYKLHLPPVFRCGLVFFELRSDQKNKACMDAMQALIDGCNLRGFWGGIILRCEGRTQSHAARLSLGGSETPISIANDPKQVPFQKRGMDMGSSRQIEANVHIAPMIRWSDGVFSEFAFDLIAMLRGTDKDGYISSWYGVSSSIRRLPQS